MVMCQTCREVLDVHRALNDRLIEVGRDLSKVAITGEIDMYNQLWIRWLGLIEESRSLRELFFSHLESHR
jgi:hypothetical protein